MFKNENRSFKPEIYGIIIIRSIPIKKAAYKRSNNLSDMQRCIKVVLFFGAVEASYNIKKYGGFILVFFYFNFKT
jgi:hypothetical protein